MTAATLDRLIPIDAYAVALDETQYYNIDPADAKYIERIDGVYVFDRNHRTACCELTLSYFLRHLYTSIVFSDGVDDATRDRLEMDYAHCEGDDFYVHCCDIDRIIKAAGRDRDHVYHYGDVAPSDRGQDIEIPDQRHTAEMDAICEDLRGNCPF